jgi:hypothetical protein
LSVLNYSRSELNKHTSTYKFPSSLSFNTQTNTCYESYILKFSDYHTSILFIEQAVYLLLLFTCLVFRNSHPLSSRGMVPFVSIVAQNLCNLSRITTILNDYEVFSDYQCYIDGILFYLSVQSMVIYIPMVMVGRIMKFQMNSKNNEIYYKKRRKQMM